MEEAGKRRLSGFFIRNKPTLVMGLLALVIAGTADLFAGFFMVTMEDYIVMIPGMIVLIYAAIGMRGNIFGAMGSRLGTAMHMGGDPNEGRDRRPNPLMPLKEMCNC